MRLIRLYSNRDSFHNIDFKSGVNLIVGKATIENENNVQKTFNGLGKSLFIKLIDFCLACDPIEEFAEKIPTWEFSLDFELLDEKYTVKRNTSSQKRIELNGVDMSLDSFRDLFRTKIFKLTENYDFLTWRTLVTHFTRPRKSSYESFDKTNSKERDYSSNINVAHLLGLNVFYNERKKILKTEFDRIDTLKKNVENDEIFKKYFTQDNDIDIQIIDLEDQIKSIRATLTTYEVSETYYEIQKDADVLKNKSQEVKNKITLLNNTLRSIKKSLEIKSDVTLDMVMQMYAEAKRDFPEMVVKKVQEVSEWHENLLTKRVQRLTENQKRTIGELLKLEEERKDISSKLDEVIKYLGKHKALDEFVAVNDKMTILATNLERLKSYKGLLQEYKNKIGEIEIEMKQENINTNNYLVEMFPVIKENITTFKSLSKEFYGDKTAGIEIKTNEGKNQLRFNIDVHIDDDTSDGLNGVKIFCFDLTLLLTKHNHLMNFVMHDSRLFSNIDPRQVGTLFKIASRSSVENNFQYIATVNQNQLDPLHAFYSKEEYKECISDNIILTLTDESAKTKLLGIKVEMDYEK